MMRSNKKNNRYITNTMRILFFIFSFTYILFFQRELIEAFLAEYASAADGFTRTLFIAILFSIALTSLSVLLNRFFNYSDDFYACCFIPSAIILGASTAFLNLSHYQSFLAKFLIVCVMAILFMIICKVISLRRYYRNIDLMQAFANNCLILTLSVCATMCVGNTDETLHRMLVMERFYNEAKYDKVLKTGRFAEEINPEISVIRAEALSAITIENDIPGSQLGWHLFEYRQCKPLTVADSLRARQVDDDMENANRQLTALLLEKRITDFSDTLQADFLNVLHYSSWTPGDIPVYYLQALLLAECMGAQIPGKLDTLYPEQCKQQRALFKEYQESKALVSGKESMQYQANYMSKRYADTYWWFFDYSD